MTISAAANRTVGWPVRIVSGWLALAAAPTFALMTWIAGHDASPMAYCSAASGVLPVDGMAAMYLLMTLFHLSPWLKLVAGRA